MITFSFMEILDFDNQSISVLRENLASLPLESPTKVITWDLSKNLNCLHSLALVIDLVFMDPPYDNNCVNKTLMNLHPTGALINGAKVIVEHSHLEHISEDLPNFTISDQRKYGKTIVSFLNYMI